MGSSKKLDLEEEIDLESDMNMDDVDDLDDNELSLDEYLDEFRGMLIEDEIDEILECLRKFDKL